MRTATGDRLLRGALVAVFLVACSSSSAGGGGDAGGDAADAAARDASEGGLGCPPVCGGDGGHAGDDAGDASETCTGLMQIIAMMQAELTTCDPQMPNQCSAFTNGPCCPVTITPGTNTENYDQAVMAYKNQCMPQCGMVCATMPTNTCVPFGDAGTSGVCAQQ